MTECEEAMGWKRPLRAQGRGWDVARCVQMALTEAKGPGLPSSSSIRRLSGRRRQDEQEMNPAGVYQLRSGCYHTRSVNVL